jgi:16S rRNA C1402 (ribose-2'-O) methylase RsmI
LKQLEPETIKGEFTLVVAGRDKSVEAGSMDRETQRRIQKLLREDNMSIKDVATRISEEKGLTYRRVYKECLSIKRALRPSGEVS